MKSRTVLLASLALVGLTATTDAADRVHLLAAEDFGTDPISKADTVLRGNAQARLEWIDDAPAFAGDRRGTLRAHYDARLPAGLFGRPLATVLTQEDSFAAAFAYVIRSEDFSADPDGFFQISFGLWNSATTGLERTGTPIDFSTDTFDCLAMDWFPNVSQFFGGPFVSPGLFGTANAEDPLFPFYGAFANASFFFGPAASLPFDTPLVTLFVHDPQAGTIRFETFSIVGPRELAPIPAASATVDRSLLSRDEFQVDTIGPLLWRDGFSGSTASLLADVDFHGMAVVAGSLDDLLEHAFPVLFGTPTID